MPALAVSWTTLAGYSLLSSLLFGAAYLAVLNRMVVPAASPYEKASISRRLRAGAVDAFAIVSVAVVSWRQGAPEVVFLGVAYAVTRDAIGGRSLGKLIFGIRVIDLTTGEAAGIRSSVVRNLLFLVPGAQLMAAILEAYTSAKDRLGLRLGDLLAHTQVVEAAALRDLVAELQKQYLVADVPPGTVPLHYVRPRAIGGT